MKEQNFKFRKSFGDLVEQMTDKQAGEFIKTVCGYVFSRIPMESKDEFLKGVFVYVKNALDTEVRDRENGRLGGIIVADKNREMRNNGATTEQTITESSIVSQLIILSGGEGDDKGADAPRHQSGGHIKKYGIPNKFKAYGGGKFAHANKDDHKAE